MTFCQQLKKVVLALCETAATPRAITVFMLLDAGEYDQLFTLKLDPCLTYVAPPRNFPSRKPGFPFNDPEKVFWDYQVTELVRKLEFDIGRDLVTEAWEGFCDDEQTNARTNVRFQRLLNGPHSPSSLVQLRFLEAVQDRVRWILGPPPTGFAEARFGKGGTIEDIGVYTTIPDKMSSRPTVYSQTRDFLPLWYESAWGRELHVTYTWKGDPKTVRGNRFGTVAKDATKRRGIASESSISGFFQLSVGRSIRAALRSRTRIDLGCAQDVHRALVKRASQDGSLASIDLSSASNLNAAYAVRAFLAKVPGWLTLLEALRAPLTLGPKPGGGKAWRHLQMFSSMGNGFTFELETVIFLAICLAAGDVEGRQLEPGVDVFVYGDDILVPTDMAQKVLMYLAWAGHKPNQRKTFTSGYFRESCGADYLNGVAIRPHFQTSFPTDPQQWISFANGLRRAAKQDGASQLRWEKMRHVWRIILGYIPSHIRALKGPAVLGDVVIHDDRDWTLRCKPGCPYVWEVKALLPIPFLLDWKHWHANIDRKSVV